MYETEANRKSAPENEVPAEISAQFGGMNARLEARTVLPWSEHCTECAWPTCYRTCDLYEPREDGRCRRFADGIVRVDSSSALNSYLLKIRFKRWGKLWTPGNVRLYSLPQAQRREEGDYRFGTVLSHLPLPRFVKAPVARRRYTWKKRMASAMGDSGPLPTSFLCECYNPEAHTVRLTLAIRPNSDAVQIQFQKLIELTPGFHRIRIPVEEISRLVDLRQPFGIELIPNDVADVTTLFFGVIEFVKEAEVPSSGAARIKCVVWDLDNTLWDGILVETGVDNLVLKPGIREVLRTLDERGILHSIASKNNADEAMAALRHFQIDDYFLCPQISWQPKSKAIATIAKELNIGRDSLLFVDDSSFEREEVGAVYPEVRTLNAEYYAGLPDLEICRVPVTEEGRERRRMYRLEGKRQEIAQGFGEDYLEFLRHCQIQLLIDPLTKENLTRVHELTQRTNQMNFSGTRYDRDVLCKILDTPWLHTYVLTCEDRFGSYGIIGFSIVDSREPRMTDLMFSCRVQSKRVEHAFLAYLLRRYVGESEQDFYANYRKTPRNAPSGRVFEDMRMSELETVDGVTSLVFRKQQEVPDEAVITVVESGVLAGTVQV